MPVAFDETVQTEAPTKRRGFMSRLRLGRNNKQQQALADKRESTPSPAMDKPVREEVREGPLPVSALRKKKSSKKNKGPKIPQRELFLLERPPTAKEAAFGGPPRYDWIDIETAAAIKVQAAFRRNKVMMDLERQGLSTAAIRNRARRRNVHYEMAGSEDTPGLFACCGVGLAFGDATEEDYEARREYEKVLYQEKKKEREEKEAALRNKIYSKRKPTAGRLGNLEESDEVVE